MNKFTLVAVTDPLLATEAGHAAAAAGAEVKACGDPREIARFAAKAAAIVVDSSTAAHVSALNPSAAVYFLSPDPGPIDYESALRCSARAAFLIPAEANELLAALRETPQVGHRPQPLGRCVALSGTAGGIGTTTLAAAWALSHSPSVLIDGCPERGGLDLTLGIEDVPGVRWPELGLGAGVLTGTDVRSVLPRTVDDVAVLSGARTTVDDPFELRAADMKKITAALRGTQPVIIDDPPVATGLPVAEAVLGEIADHVVVVTAAQVKSVAAAKALVCRLKARSVSLSLVVRHCGWSSLEVAEIEKIINVDVTAVIPTIRRLPRAAEQTGLAKPLPKALKRACGLLDVAVGWS